MRQKKNRLEHYEKTAKQQQFDMKKRIAQINELEKVSSVVWAFGGGMRGLSFTARTSDCDQC